MSGFKRSFSAEDNSAILNDNNDQLTSPNDTPDSKKFRHESSHSENEDDTQIIEQENGITNGKINKNYFLQSFIFLNFRSFNQSIRNRRRRRRR
jgi:hypothetical protein